jgi:hypothetical protein
MTRIQQQKLNVAYCSSYGRLYGHFVNLNSLRVFPNYGQTALFEASKIGRPVWAVGKMQTVYRRKTRKAATSSNWGDEIPLAVITKRFVLLRGLWILLIVPSLVSIDDRVWSRQISEKPILPLKTPTAYTKLRGENAMQPEDESFLTPRDHEKKNPKEKRANNAYSLWLVRNPRPSKF